MVFNGINLHFLQYLRIIEIGILLYYITMDRFLLAGKGVFVWIRMQS
jgi:hypothetical protein